MYHALTIHLPDSLFEEAQCIAWATSRALEEIIVCAATTRLPVSKGLPEEIAEDLAGLELLDVASLHEVMRSGMPPLLEQRLGGLLVQQQVSGLEAGAQAELQRLLSEADRWLLHKARTAMLLRLRGDTVPSLKELSEPFSFFQASESPAV